MEGRAFGFSANALVRSGRWLGVINTLDKIHYQEF